MPFTSAGISKAIQWGFMGDVGIVQRDLGGNDHFHMGLVPQRSQSFLSTLDHFLSCRPEVVLSSVVVAELTTEQDSFGADDTPQRIISDIIKIIGQ